MDAETLMRAVEARRREAQAVYYAEPLPNEPPAAAVVAARDVALARLVLETRDAERDAERARAADRAAARARADAVRAARETAKLERLEVRSLESRRRADARLERLALEDSERAARADARRSRKAARRAARESREAAAAARLAEVLAALRGASSVTAAAEFLGCDRAAIAYWAERNAEVRAALPDGRETRQRTEADAAASRRRRKYSDAELFRALESAGGNMARAAEALSCPAPSVRDRVQRDPALRAARDRFQVEAEAARRAEIAAALRKAGGRLAEAAEFLPVSVRQLRRWVRADAALRAVWNELRAA